MTPSATPAGTVLDPGTVRVGAGMKRRPAVPATTAAPPAARPVPNASPAADVAALVADPGTVRVGAGMRRAVRGRQAT
jgi:hypothetical protein